MRETFEISDRYIEPGSADGLLYEPLEGSATYRATRRYEIEYEGETEAMKSFVERVLFDPVSQEFHQGEAAALKDFTFALDYGMKPGALDLEKEAILAHYRGIEEPGFDLKNLAIRQRVYLFGAREDDSKRFVRDICNAAIHHWTVIKAE